MSKPLLASNLSLLGVERNELGLVTDLEAGREGVQRNLGPRVVAPLGYWEPVAEPEPRVPWLQGRPPVPHQAPRPSVLVSFCARKTVFGFG